MSRLTILTGRAGSGKTAAAMAAIADAVGREEPGQLLLVPEQYSHEAEKELCRVCGDSLSLYGEVLSFTRLAARVEDELGGHRRLLDKGGRLLTMKLALTTLAGRLKVYGAAVRRPELQKALLRTVTELKNATVGPEALLTAAEVEPGALGNKLRDLSLILGAYDAVAAQGGADPADRLSLLAVRLPDSSLGRTGQIYIDGFSDFTAQELAVLAALMNKGAPMTVCLTCDSLSGGSEVFDAARRTAARLLTMAAERGWHRDVRTLTPPEEARTPVLRFVEAQLFAYTSAPCPPGAEAVALYTAPDALAECELAAARCLALVRETGCRWRDIAVAVRGFDRYAQLLESVFAHYGVPLYLGRRSSILEKPLPAMLTAAFEVLSGGWDGEAVLAWLKTGLAGAEPGELDELENYALLWDIRGGAWTREEAWTQSPEGFSGPLSPREAEKLAALDALRRRLCVPLHRYELDSRAAETAAAQVRRFADFLAELGLAETLARRAEALTARGRNAQAMEYAQLWEILTTALEQFYTVLGDTPMDREEFGALLTAMLSQYDVGTIPASLDMVSAGDMDRMRRRHLKHLIVLGATDAALPAPETPDVLLTAEERERLAELGVALRCPRTDGLFRELELIYNCLSLPSDSLTMSCPTAGADGSESRQSVILARLAALTGQRLRPFDRAAAMASAPAPALELAARGDGPLARAAWAYFAERPDYAARLARLSAGADRRRDRLSPAAVRALYGEPPRLSASRAERFAQCGFAYFMQYGLAARPRQRAGFDPPELGKFMHFVLEGVTRGARERGGFAGLEVQERDALADKYVERYIREVLHDFRDKSERFVYLFRRLTGTVRRVVADMAEELAVSDFVPLDFELDLSRAAVSLTDGENTVAVTGIADRVDGWMHDGKLYLRVVDYKTGQKAFSLSDVWYGMGLQMLMYLFTLERIGSARYGAEVVPAGVLYVPARDVLVSAPGEISDEEILAARGKKLRRSGLVLAEDGVVQAMEHGDSPRYIPVKFTGEDGRAVGDSLVSREQLGLLARHIEKTLLALAGELRAGQIDVAPAFHSSVDNACRWCDYREACRFDERRDRRRWQTSLQTPVVWERLRAEGEEMDDE